MLLESLADFFGCLTVFIGEIFPFDMYTTIFGCLTFMCALAVWRIIS